MSSSSDDLILSAGADEAYARGNLQEALDCYVELINDDAGHLFAWYRTALIAGKLSRRKEVGTALALVAEAMSRTGRLHLTLAALRELEEYDAAACVDRLREVSMLYGKGSRRLEGRYRPQPPPPPGGKGGGDTMGIEVDDIDMMFDLAMDACVKAAQKYRKDAPEPQAKVPAHPLFSELKPADLRSLVNLLEIHNVPAGEELITQGGEGNSFFMLVRGAVQVSRVDRSGEHQRLASMGTGALFGEMALLTDSPRVATVTTTRPSLLFEIKRKDLEKLVERNPGVGEVLGAYTRTRLLRNLMSSSPLFKPLDAERKQGLRELFETEIYGAEEVILREGETSSALRVVLSGEVRVTRADGQEELELAELGPGQIFGEISMIQGKPVTATVTTRHKTVVLSLTRESFNAHVAEFPEVLTHLYQVAMERESANQRIASGPLVPVGDKELLV